MKSAVLLTIVAALAIAGIALATPGSGVVSAPVLARATFPDPFKIRLRNPAEGSDATVQQVTIAPGGHTGWHTHPGPVLVLVKEGTFTLYDGNDRKCTGRAYGSGQGFVDRGYGHVHIGRNEGATDLVLYAVFLDVPVGGATRLDAASPGNCPF